MKKISYLLIGLLILSLAGCQTAGKATEAGGKARALYVFSTPSGADVYVDDVKLTVTSKNSWIYVQPDRRYVLKFVRPWYVDESVAVQLHPDSYDDTVAVTLTPSEILAHYKIPMYNEPQDIQAKRKPGKDYSKNNNRLSCVKCPMEGPMFRHPNSPKEYVFEGSQYFIGSPQGSHSLSKQAFTFSLWVNINGKDKFETPLPLIAMGGNIPGNERYYLYIEAKTGKLRFNAKDLVPNSTVSQSSIGPGIHHLAVTRGGIDDNVQIYIDGELDTAVITGAKGAIKFKQESFYIGRYNKWYFKGGMHDIRIYGRELSPPEVRKLYTTSELSFLN